ncbi:MAG: amidohydrolase family protein [Chloroflexi bacterium]|nr:amidohydrolase family protein [Chloroflexota bacterium]
MPSFEFNREPVGVRSIVDDTFDLSRYRDALSVVRKHPNVYADISAQFYRPWSFWNGMRLFHEWGVTDKIFFATDWPVATPDENMSGIRNVCKFAIDRGLPEIPERVIEEIINRDAAAILGVG